MPPAAPPLPFSRHRPDQGRLRPALAHTTRGGNLPEPPGKTMPPDIPRACLAYCIKQMTPFAKSDAWESRHKSATNPAGLGQWDNRTMGAFDAPFSRSPLIPIRMRGVRTPIGLWTPRSAGQFGTKQVWRTSDGVEQRSNGSHRSLSRSDTLDRKAVLSSSSPIVTSTHH